MERKPHELEVKQVLLSRLSEITLSSSDEASVILSRRKTKITIRKNYDTKKFRFLPGQFIQVIYGCSRHPKNEIMLCVGIGKGCPDDKERDELWFLGEEDEGITHFCASDSEDFNKWEEEGELIFLGPDPDVMN
jgi:hypothetical protein